MVCGRRRAGNVCRWDYSCCASATVGASAIGEGEGSSCTSVGDMPTTDEDGLACYSRDHLGRGGWTYGKGGNFVAEDLGRGPNSVFSLRRTSAEQEE